jgi:hypothetical protein
LSENRDIAAEIYKILHGRPFQREKTLEDIRVERDLDRLRGVGKWFLAIVSQKRRDEIRD